MRFYSTTLFLPRYSTLFDKYITQHMMSQCTKNHHLQCDQHVPQKVQKPNDYSYRSLRMRTCSTVLVIFYCHTYYTQSATAIHNQQSQRYSLCTVMPYVVQFAYRITLNISRRSRHFERSNVLEHVLIKISTMGNCGNHVK